MAPCLRAAAARPIETKKGGRLAPFSVSAPDAGVHGVAQPVADIVHAQHRQRDQQAGKDHPPRIQHHLVHGVEQQPSPGREVGRKAQAQEGQRAFGDDRGGNAQGRGHHDRRQHVGQDVARDHPVRRCADGPRGQDELAFLQAQHLAAHDAGGLHPAGRADGGHDQEEDAKRRAEGLRQRLAEQRHHQQQQGQQRQRQEQLCQAHQRRIQPAEIARHHADQAAQEDRDDHRGQADGDGHLAARHQARQQVAAQLVGAQGWAAEKPELRARMST